jgi:hypothetical protein
MVNSRSLPVALLCLAISTLALAGKALAADLDYAIFRNGEKVGGYSFSIIDEGHTRHVHATMRILVKLLGVTAYQASHERREIWNGNRLMSLEGRSDYNGKSYDLALQRDGDSASLLINGTPQPLGPKFFTFVPWLIEGKEPAQLVTEKGRLLDVSAEDFGNSPLPGEDGKAVYRRYVYWGEQPRDAWYDETGILVLMTYKQNNAEIRIRLAPTK